MNKSLYNLSEDEIQMKETGEMALRSFFAFVFKSASFTLSGSFGKRENRASCKSNGERGTHFSRDKEAPIWQRRKY